MKRMALALAAVLFLTGCGADDQRMEQALELRGRCLGASECGFRAKLTLDYTDTVEEFTLDCSTDPDGNVTFSVAAPEEIAGISGKITGSGITFDDTVLAFGLLAQDRLSPVSAPWVLMNCLRSGYITACCREGELLRITVDDSYADDALTMEIWVREDRVTAAEISWQGRRLVSMIIENFTLV